MPRNTVKFSIFSFRVSWMLWSDKREMRCPTKEATKEIINASSDRTIWNLITPFLTAYSLRIVTRKLKSAGFSFLRWGIDQYGWKVSSIILKKMMNKGCNPFKATAVSCLEDDGESQWEKKYSRNICQLSPPQFFHTTSLFSRHIFKFLW